MAFPCPKPGHHALRKGRWSEPGRVYLVTTTTHRRAPWFADWELASRMSAALAHFGTWSPHAELLCWVLMPDHWHGLVGLRGRASLSDAVGWAKGRTAHAVREAAPGRIWADGFHDRALRREDDVRGAARYIVANPVRAGLVSRVRDYPYWDAVWLE